MSIFLIDKQYSQKQNCDVLQYGMIIIIILSLSECEKCSVANK